MEEQPGVAMISKEKRPSGPKWPLDTLVKLPASFHIPGHKKHCSLKTMVLEVSYTTYVRTHSSSGSIARTHVYDYLDGKPSIA